MNDSLDLLYKDVKEECIKLIYDKNVDMEELSFCMGLDEKSLYNILNSNNKDFSLYLKLYDLLLGW